MILYIMSQNKSIYNLIKVSLSTSVKQLVYDMNVATNKVFCLGKKKASNEQPQHRLLLVALENESDKATLIAHSSQLLHHDKYYMMPDKTKFQKAKHKRLFDELKQRRAKGEVDLVIHNGSIMKKMPPLSNRCK